MAPVRVAINGCVAAADLLLSDRARAAFEELASPLQHQPHSNLTYSMLRDVYAILGYTAPRLVSSVIS